ncbi:gluconate 2-dehydrogenase subunit 3 family protein [Shewanella gaetbuli]|uniref:Gluconate 2-dehydrogenase subunit 3 family protein n=1 Tax=Shewanella gaetbuli TaxID=220752 RepID=A0A9X1ZRR4_9GAMM|nr:gluconate 2-dehydrogenase subunit 3 family protein [Shewanella gaetbuli]MCL1142888.1 gluconate 2-dehydrogenase subunit 3 family protein [Shewanella gaetbuli]
MSTENMNSYHSNMSRRESLKLLGTLSAMTIIPMVTGCSLTSKSTKGHWPTLNLAPITAKGYGKDPNLIIPPSSPWPKTLTASQLNLVAVLADIIVPEENGFPAASQVNVPDVVDEWVSAPYSRQQNDRVVILSTLIWIDDEAKLRFNKEFVQLSNKQQLAIMDDIAYRAPDLAEEFVQIAEAFALFRGLVLAAYFCSPAGMKDIGYMGNVPIVGDYPGPTPEAKDHLDKVLKELGLEA